MSTQQPNDFKKRQSERIAVDSVTQMQAQRWYNVEVNVRDVSRSGFKAECAEPVEIGSFVTLRVPGIGKVEAQVRWQIGGRMGGMFVDPISLTECKWTAERLDPPVAA
jgi:hypothetical protein